jgi:manganese transport protein
MSLDPRTSAPDLVTRSSASLPEVYKSIPIPAGAGFWRKLLAFAGPGYLVAVGYMDPGNWATDLAGGARYGYQLLCVIVISNFMAILLQALSARLGIASGRDLAQACRDRYSRPTTVMLWIVCEIAIAACDLAEVIGAAIALQLLFGLPLAWGVALTSLDVLIVLYLQHHGFRYVEALVIGLILAIAGAFAIEIWLARPAVGALAGGLVPHLDLIRDRDMLYIAISILGATVMPHNLYLHSSIVQTRQYLDTESSKREAIRFATIDSSVALMSALFINAAILIMAAATFHGRGHEGVASIGDAYQLLTPLLGTSVASAAFAIALLCSGQNANRDGGVHQHPPPALAPATHHATHRDHPGAHRRHPVRRARHGLAAHPQPGDLEHAVALRGGAPRTLHERPAPHGHVREPAMALVSRVADHRRDHRLERVAALSLMTVGQTVI